MSQFAITDYIPHRPPMLLIDEVVQSDAKQIVCRKSFGHEEFFVQGHYPDQAIVPGVILCECAAQSGAVMLAKFHVEDSELSRERVPVLTRMGNVRFKRPVHPGDQIEITVSLTETMSGAFFMAAVIRRENKIVASLDFACTLADKVEA